MNRLHRPQLEPFLRGMFGTLIPKWSVQLSRSAEFGCRPVASRSMVKEGQALALSPGFRKLNEGVYFCQQKTSKGKLHPISRKRAQEVVQILQKKKWSYDNLRLVSTCHITNATSCWPCVEYAGKGICYHVIAVRIRTREPINSDEPDTLLQGARRGRPSRVRIRYVADFARDKVTPKKPSPGATMGPEPPPEPVSQIPSPTARGKP